MGHLGWFFLLDEDLDAFGLAVEDNCGPVTWSTTEGRERRWPSLRAASENSGLVLVRPGADRGRSAAWIIPPRLLDDDTLRGGNLSHAFGPTELAVHTEVADFIESIRKAMIKSTHPWIRARDGRTVRSYRIGDSAADWYRALPTRVLRDESSPYVSYELVR